MPPLLWYDHHIPCRLYARPPSYTATLEIHHIYDDAQRKMMLVWSNEILPSYEANEFVGQIVEAGYDDNDRTCLEVIENLFVAQYSIMRGIYDPTLGSEHQCIP